MKIEALAGHGPAVWSDRVSEAESSLLLEGSCSQMKGTRIERDKHYGI